MAKVDKELEEFRNLMEVPTKFEDGFTFSSLLGAIFLALIMVPGSLYMELLAGCGVGGAAQWVTVILFIEIAKRANAKLSRPQLFILFYMSGMIVGQSVHSMPLFQQFMVNSEAAVSSGISTLFPTWVAPQDPSAYSERTFFSMLWLPVIGLIVFSNIFGTLSASVLGYGLFRRTSDVEKLPFPMAPMGAQGIMALADEMDNRVSDSGAWRWRMFSLGGAIGMLFGLLYMGVPTLTGAIFNRTMQIFPIPFVDLTQNIADFWPATALSFSFDFGNVVIGMVMPYYSMLGSFIGAAAMLISNKFLFDAHILHSWQSSMGAVETIFRNNIDFYLSLGIGISMAVAAIGLSAVFRSLWTAKKEKDAYAAAANQAGLGRGDIPNRWILICYFVTSLIYVLLSGWLIDWHMGVMAVLLFFAFIYTPIISYVTARLEGMAGQAIEIPYIREIAFLCSGYQSGVAVWFLPVPKANYGTMTVFYRQAELTGTKFTSIWKTQLVLYPMVILSMICFSSFIWGLDDVPSSKYPYTMEIWDFEAKNACLIYSSTIGEYSEFDQALNLPVIGAGTLLGLLLYGALSLGGAPIMLFYGLVRGLSGALVHWVLPQFAGALLGKFYFQRKFGENWRKYITVISAGFFCGSGLITMFCIGIRFLMGATNPSVY